VEATARRYSRIHRVARLGAARPERAVRKLVEVLVALGGDAQKRLGLWRAAVKSPKRDSSSSITRPRWGDDHACARVVGELLVETEAELVEEALRGREVAGRQVDEEAAGRSEPNFVGRGGYPMRRGWVAMRPP
jgi:hypothetical protein